MSLATRCTQCGTIFRVVQDQLKVSEGWVRCGRCQEVFNALEGLFDLEREAPPQRAPGTLSATEVAARGMAEFVASHHPPLAPTEDPQPPLPATQEDDAIESRFFAPVADERDDEDPDFVDARFPSELPADAALGDEAAAAPPPEPEPRRPLLQRWRERRDAQHAASVSSLLEPPSGIAATPPPPPEPEVDPLLAATPRAAVVAAGTPGFLREAENAARWQRPRVRASLVVLGLLLAGMLVVQIGVQFRDTLAAQRPALRPHLTTLCELMGCTIGPLRQLASLTVESSGLTQVEGSEAYRLSLGLLNRGKLPLAPPAVELSLTDGSGALIARRALLPSDFRQGGSPAGTPLAGETETSWQLLLATPGLRVAGYTVELFYP